MQGLMQDQPLLLSSLIKHAARHHGTTEVVSQMSEAVRHRTTYAEAERRARRLALALGTLGVNPGDRVATLAWNTYRHRELYYAISGSAAVCHTVNPRLSLDDITYIMQHAGDTVLFADLSFTDLVSQIVDKVPSLRAIVMLAQAEEMPPLRLPADIELYCYEDLILNADGNYEWPIFDEGSASALCYTSGTTGRPKGVLYSHRSAILHDYASNLADSLGLRAVDRVLPAASMYHVTGWAIPYCAPMVGATLVLLGRHLDGPTLTRLLNDEQVTFAGGVPTIWFGVLDHMRSRGVRFTALKRLLVAGSACPQLLIEKFGSFGVEVHQAWGMTETSPFVTYHAPKPATAELTGEESVKLRLRQGRALYGADIKIVDHDGKELLWNGIAFGNLLCRGSWVTREYLNRGIEGAAGPDGWFDTGDVATIDPEGYVHLVDRSKDVIKSGGEWISSITLENIAVAHSDVAEAAIIAAKHPKWMERPLLLVVPRDRCTIDKKSILQLYENAVPKWWVPDDVLVVEKLAYTATGKLNKLLLRSLHGDHLLNFKSAEL